MPENLVALSMHLPAQDHRELAINAAALGTSRNALMIAGIRMINAQIAAGLAASETIAAVKAAHRRRGRRPGTPNKKKGG